MLSAVGRGGFVITDPGVLEDGEPPKPSEYKGSHWISLIMFSK